ncbi:glycosyl hydrolase [Bacteroidia bacterium]|nr:glycosyl hydrolase [Bacteroidia bacterium]
MLVVGFRGAMLTPQNHIYNDIKTLHIGGVILFDYDAINKTYERNIFSPAQVKKLCRDLQAIDAKLLIGIDQEGGKVNRLKEKRGFAHTVTAQYLGTLNNADSTRYYAKSCAQQLKKLGFNLNFVPCVDLNINPRCPVIGGVERSFSADSKVVQTHAAIWVQEHHKQGILTSLKHFPGHGSSTKDSHKGIADVSETWTDKELQPYRYFVANPMCDMIMVAHVFNRRIDPDYPASLSQKIIQGLLRQQLKYKGLVITDDLAMGAIAEHYSLEQALEKAINAGADMLILSNNGNSYNPQLAKDAVDVIEKLVQQGRVESSGIDEAYRRIVALKNKLKP